MRARGAVVLVVCFAIAFVTVVLGVYIPAVRFSGPGLSDSGLELTTGILGALIGAVGSALSRELTGYRALVGFLLACTLGAVALVVVGFVMYDAVSTSTPGISANTGKVLATILGGIIGILLGYLGLGLAQEGAPTVPDADPWESPSEMPPEAGNE